MYLYLFNKYGDNTMPEISLTSNLENLIIIGKAGIGKSTYIKSNFSKDYILTSFTNISAIQINGVTLSSFFKLGVGNTNSISKSVSIIKSNKLMLKKIRENKGLVVDEFYTVSSDIMDKVDIICQKLRDDIRPFGGLQLILVGDDRQTEAIENPFVNSQLYKNIIFKEIVLKEHDNMRLNYEYMKFCDLFRNPGLNKNKIFRLLQNPNFSKSEFTVMENNTFTVYYTNVEVRNRNDIEMKKLDNSIIYENYKKNCRIYITKNSERSSGLCNGMIGKLLSYDINTHEFEIEITADIESESKIYKSNVIEFDMGFAMTIHKCQSKTFKNINIHIKKNDIINNRSKYIRLLYVALSRVRDFSNCYIHLE